MSAATQAAPALRTIHSRTVVLALDDIDTDQIIPARFLKTTVRDGLGRHAFADWRYAPDGSPRAGFVLNEVDIAAHRILVGGRNFGCGSSREHAPWALLDLGLRAVISTQFADIFRTNALENGLLALPVAPAVHQWLLAHPGAELGIDLEAGVLSWPGGAPLPLDIEPFARYRLLHGVSSLEYLQSQAGAIAAFEVARGSAGGAPALSS